MSLGDAGRLVGLWEHRGMWSPEQRRIVEWPPESIEAAVREFLYFDANGRFFYVKFRSDSRIYFDPIKLAMTSSDGLRPLLEGTWRLDGRRLVEWITDPPGESGRESTLEIAELSAERLVIAEPTTDPDRTFLAAYARADWERFAAPLSELERTVAGEAFDGAAAAHLQAMPAGDLRAVVQVQQNEIERLVGIGRLNSAQRLARESAELAIAAFGLADPNTAACLSSLGGCLHKLGEHDKALAIVERARDIYVGTVGETHELTALAFNNLAPIYRATRRFGSSLSAALDAVAIRAGALGPRSPKTAVSILNLGYALAPLGHVGRAATCYLLAERRLTDTLGAAHPLTQTAARNYEILLSSIDDDGRFERIGLPSRETLSDADDILDGIVSDARLLLADAGDDDDFILRTAVPRHRESYLNIAFAIKKRHRAIARKANGDARPETMLAPLRKAQNRVLTAAAVPVTALDDPLKKVDRAKLGPIAAATLQHAFPNFAGDPDAARARRSDLIRFGIDPDKHRSLQDERLAELARTGAADRFKIVEVNRQFRRYAGENNLPSACYWSVCVDETGDDGQTLCRELFEYTDPSVPGFVFVTDTWDREAVAALVRAGVLPRAPDAQGLFVFLLAPPDEAERAAFRYFYGPILEAVHGPVQASARGWDGLTIAFVPTVAETVDIARVIDLRHRTTQDWLHRFFGRGDGAVFNKLVAAESFAAMLPALVYPEYGGSGTTKSIGSWMRTMGLDGLVFPSARSDASASFGPDGRCTAHHGWNFVDYRAAAFVPDQMVHIDYNPWYGFAPGRQSAPVLEITDRSWRIRGSEERYDAFRSMLLDFFG